MEVIFLLGSESDKEHGAKIAETLEQWGIVHQTIVASAHKVPEKVFAIVSQNNQKKSLIYITVVGRSNGLGGVVAANSIHPVINCPPFKDKDDYQINIHSSLMMPSDTPLLTILEPQNAALAAVRIFALSNQKLWEKLIDHLKKIKASFK